MSGTRRLPRGGRIREPAETVRRMRPRFGAFGITRLARQTGLDRIGIPVWAAMRPNSLTLAVNQGKGIDDDFAMASAVMEAVEFAIAEHPERVTRLATRSALVAEGARVHDPVRLMPAGASLPDGDELAWLEGRQLLGGDAVWVPLEAARLDHTGYVFGGMSRSSNGLASGNDLDEAVLHAVCELVERDAATLHAFRSWDDLEQLMVDPASFEDESVDALADRIWEAGVELRLFDLTTDIGIPVIQAVLRDRGREVRAQFDLAAGTGCHPVASHAAVRAITEAAQTRVTNISGARDDLDPAEYREPLRPGLGIYSSLVAAQGRAAPRDACGPLATAPAELLSAVAGHLRRVGISDVPVVELGGAAAGVNVVRVFAPQLEDRPSNRHWRPGSRAMGAMLRL